MLFVPCDNRQPIKYLVTLHKNDSVKKMEKALLDLMNEESCDMIIAEVLDNHISRILVRKGQQWLLVRVIYM